MAKAKVPASKRRLYLWCLSFLKPYRWHVAAFIACGLVVSAVQLAIPRAIQTLIDEIIPSRRFDLFAWLLTGIAAALVVMFLAEAASNLMERTVREYASRDLTLAVFDQLRRLGFSYFERTAVGETLSLFHNEIPAVEGIYYRYFPQMVQRLSLLAVSAVLMLSTSPRLSLLVVPFALGYYVMGPRFERKAGLLAQDVNESRSAFTKKLYDSISAMLELRANRAVAWDRKRLLEHHAKLKRLSLLQVLNALYRGTVRRVLVNLGAAALFVYGARLIQQGALTLGAFVAFTFYYLRVVGEFTYVITSITEQRLLMYQAQRVYDVLQLRPDVEESENPVTLPEIQGRLALKDVHFSYRPGLKVIDGFDLEIRPGERIALVGASGSGKSTLFKLIGRFYDPDEGEIFLDGVSLRELSLGQLRDAVGYVFQETYLFGTTIRENIRFGNPDASDDAIVQAAKAARAHEFIMQFPDGYETIVGERGIKLSGGQKQRIAIARMIVKNPRIVLLDEATSALDQINEAEVRAALETLLEGRTTIAAAHRLSTIQDYDRIVFVEQGRVAEVGSYAELMACRGRFYRLSQGEEAAV